MNIVQVQPLQVSTSLPLAPPARGRPPPALASVEASDTVEATYLQPAEDVTYDNGICVVSVLEDVRMHLFGLRIAAYAAQGHNTETTIWEQDF